MFRCPNLIFRGSKKNEDNHQLHHHHVIVDCCYRIVGSTFLPLSLLVFVNTPYFGAGFYRVQNRETIRCQLWKEHPDVFAVWLQLVDSSSKADENGDLYRPGFREGGLK